MPKEVIRDDAGTFDTVVGWTREPGGNVQVATVMVPPPPGAPQNLIELAKSWEGQGYIGDPDSPNGPTGLWSTLDRHGVNQLIRVLRRARDAAFGCDE